MVGTVICDHKVRVATTTCDSLKHEHAMATLTLKMKGRISGCRSQKQTDDNLSDRFVFPASCLADRNYVRVRTVF